MRILLLTSLFVLSSLAEAQVDKKIKSKQFNADIFQIGSIQKSILSVLKFQELHGNCWREMNGGNIASTDLSSLKSITTLPNADSRFLRNKGVNSATVGSLQDDSLGSHRHWISNGPFDDGNGSGSNGNSQVSGLMADAGAYSDSDPMYNYGRYILPAGSSETRPVNVTVNMFIKVNHDCE